MDKAEKGKKLFLTIAIIALIVSLIEIIPSVLNKGILGVVQGLIRTGLEGMFLYYTFKGRKWAKIIMITLLSIGLLLVLILSISLIHAVMHPVMYSLMYLTFIILLVVYGGLLYTIAFAPSFKEYLKSLNR
jgi:hypothetical protein